MHNSLSPIGEIQKYVCALQRGDMIAVSTRKGIEVFEFVSVPETVLPRSINVKRDGLECRVDITQIRRSSPELEIMKRMRATR